MNPPVDTCDGSGRQDFHGRLSGDDVARHHPQAVGVRDSSVV